MELKQLDLSTQSRWLYHTPSEIGRAFPFYLTECGFFSGGEGYYTKRDSKDSFLLVYTVSGSGRFLYHDTLYVIQSGQALLLDCNGPHSYETLVAPWTFYWIHLNGQAVKHYAELINEDGLGIIDIFDQQEFIEYTKKLEWMLKNHDMHTDLKASLYLTHLTTLMLSNKKLPQNQKAFHHQQDLQKAVIFIQSHFNTEISVEDMAEVAHLSKFHFLRLFKEVMGISPFDYLIHYRTTQSKAMLQSSSDSVQAISEQVGYKNANNYIRNFKKLVGMTPSQYRKTRV